MTVSHVKYQEATVLYEGAGITEECKCHAFMVRNTSRLK